MAEIDDPLPAWCRPGTMVARSRPGPLMRLCEHGAVAQFDPVDHEQAQRRDEQGRDLFVAYVRPGHVDAEPVGGQAAAVSEGHGRVELRAVLRRVHAHPAARGGGLPGMRPLRTAPAAQSRNLAWCGATLRRRAVETSRRAARTSPSAPCASALVVSIIARWCSAS